MQAAAGTPLSTERATAGGRVAPFGLAASASLLSGVVFALWQPVVPSVALAVVALLAGLFAGLLALLRGSPALSWLAWLCLGSGLASLHAAQVLAGQLPPRLEGTEFVVDGRVAGLPEQASGRVTFDFRVEAGEALPDALRGARLRLSWHDGTAVVLPGERWRFRVRLRAPRGLRNPGGFDAEKYAFAGRSSASGSVRSSAATARLAPAHGVDAWRAATSGRIAAALSSPSSRFIRALALGDTRGLDDGDWQRLRATGLTHLIAISGFHVGLVAGFAALSCQAAWWCWPGLGRRMPRPVAAALAAFIGAALYAAVAGFALPTVRTVLMIGVAVATRVARRRSSLPDALSMALIAVLLVDPLAVLGAGFWLSFAGVAWLMWCLPRVEKRPVRGFVSAQGVATVGLLPLTAVLFGQASLAGPLANLVAVPWWSLVVVPLALLGTGLDASWSGAGDWAWQLAALCFDLAWPLFEWMADGRLALLWLPEPAVFALPLALLGAFWLLLPRGVPGKPLALMLWLPLMLPSLERPGPGELEMHVLDVGQGLAVVVRTSGHVLLYDTGPLSRTGHDAGERVVVPALHALGTKRLDRIMLSHMDADHAGGLAAVQAAFDVDATIAPHGAGLDGSTACVAGDAWAWDGVWFEVLHPTPFFPYLGNESSCVLRIATRHGTVLLTGDIGEIIEQRLLRIDADKLRADVVVVPHHGSNGSSTPGFVAAVGARHALVSTAHGNRFRHPRPEVLDRWTTAGAAWHDTADSGSLRVGLGAGGIEVEARRRAQPRGWDAEARRGGASAGP